MDPITKRAATLSISGHLLVLVIAVVLSMVHLFQKEEEPIVMELVDLSSVEDAPAEPSTKAATRTPEIPEPETKAIKIPKFSELPKIPDVTIAEPEPAPKPEPKLEPKPEPKPKPKAEPKPEPPKAPETVSYEEWAKNRNLPKQVETTKRVDRKPVKINTIDTNIREALSSSLSDFTVRDSRSATDSTALARYLTVVHSRIQSAFKPLGGGLTAQVEFNIEADGRITGVRFLSKSGETAFDNSVLDAFRRVKSPGPPPDNRSLPLSIRFSSE